MRLLALLTDGYGARGGIARYNQDLFAALSQSTAVSEVIVLPRFGDASVRPPAKVRQLPPSRDRAAWSARAVATALRGRFDSVFCGHLNPAPLGAMIAAALRAPLWLQAHGIEAWSPRGALHRRALARAKMVTAVSRHTRRKLLSWSDLPPHRVRVLPNTFTQRPAPRGASDIARDLAGKRVILTVGRLAAGERYKGHDRIIAALPAVLAQVPDVVYLIVGSGDDRLRLQELARKTAMADRVLFAGEAPDADLPDYFAAADVFAMPSSGEGFGIVFLEAAAAGLPVIGGNRDGSLDALADGRIGRAIDPDAQGQLVGALVDSLQNGRAGEPQDLERFSFANFAGHVDELVQTLAR
jgi:phosphatidylinositol alpha-1,6-mannosyltransferase